MANLYEEIIWPLRMIFDIVSSCIILHNICIVMKNDFGNGWIVEVKDKLPKKTTNGTIRAQENYVQKGQQ